MDVQAHQSAWSDERLDDLNQTVRDGFARTDAENRGLRVEMSGLRSEMNDGFARTDGRIDDVNERFDSFQRTMLLGMIGLVGTTVASALATIVTLA